MGFVLEIFSCECDNFVIFGNIYEAIQMIDNGDTYLACNGRLIALDSKFAKSLRLPSKLQNNDAYIYVQAKINNLKFSLVENAICYYRNPRKLSEYLKQSLKFNRSLVDNSRFFDRDISHLYTISSKILFKAFVLTLAKQPVRVFLYACLKAYAKGLSFLRKNYSLKRPLQLFLQDLKRALLML